MPEFHSYKSFLDQIRRGKSTKAACEASGLSRPLVNRERLRDPLFARLWDLALEEGTEVLEDEVLRRAVEGVRQPIYQRGRLVGHKKEYSDGLAMFLLKARKPHKYRDSLQLTGDPSAPVAIAAIERKVIDVVPRQVEHLREDR